MQLANVLSGIGISVYGETAGVALNWIGKAIRGLINGVGSVGFGIIIFTLILKLIVLPFDIHQRITMRKQNIKMEQNKARMEKLQKQYANDKETYNKKVMELQKEAGFSACSSCLPMILSLVIFIVAINAFNDYAKFANVQNYNDMVDAYNTRILSECVDLDNDALTFSERAADPYTITVDGQEEQRYDHYLVVETTDKNIYFEVKFTQDDNTTPENEGRDQYSKYLDNYDPTTIEYDYADLKATEKNYYIDGEKAQKSDTALTEFVKDARADALESNPALTPDELLEVEDTAIKNYYIGKAQDAVVVRYNTSVKNRSSFFWIKNVWMTDASYKHPIASYTDFKTELSASSGCGSCDGCDGATVTNIPSSDAYNNVTAKLGAQKSEANGYYILIVLSIGTILLQQFVSMRSQKAQNKYSSVDGSSGSQQKMMLVIMTVMFAIFSFMYSAAFSIYMIMSNVLSLISTLIINKLVDMHAAKKEEEAFRAKHDRKYAQNKNVKKK